MVKERLFANPSRPASYAAGGDLQIKNAAPAISNFQNYFSDVLHLGKNQYTLQPLKAGSIVVAGTILGRLGQGTPKLASHLQFMIRPAGKNAPYIDPKPILDGWKLLEATAVYRAAGKDPFWGPGAKNPTVGQVLLMSKEQLTNRVLSDPHVQIYACGRRDIQAGLIDRRVLAVIEFLSASGLKPTVSGLECGHSLTASSGVDAAGATGASVDISKVNNIPIRGNQGAGSITDITIRRLLTLQGDVPAERNRLADELQGPEQHAQAPRPRQPHPGHLHAALRPEQEALSGDHQPPVRQPVDQPDQPHQPDPRADRPDRTQQIRDQGRRRPVARGPELGARPSAQPASRAPPKLPRIAQFFRFSQVELPWALGPPDGRYLLRAPEAPEAGGQDAPSHVLVVATLGAVERRARRFGRRAKQAQAAPQPEPTPVTTGRATVIEVAEPFSDERQAADWLSAAGEEQLAEDLAVLNRALHAFRLAAADPYVNPVDRHQALVARVGYGLGDEVADGLWTDARELLVLDRRLRRSKVLHPQARLAALLGGRERSLACEELALRARLDLEQGREREAALQLMVALDAAIAELPGDDTAAELAERIDQLRAQRDPVAVAAQAALEGPLDDEQRELVVFVLGRIEAALRARAVAGPKFSWKWGGVVSP